MYVLRSRFAIYVQSIHSGGCQRRYIQDYYTLGIQLPARLGNSTSMWKHYYVRITNIYGGNKGQIYVDLRPQDI